MPQSLDPPHLDSPDSPLLVQIVFQLCTPSKQIRFCHWSKGPISHACEFRHTCHLVTQFGRTSMAARATQVTQGARAIFKTTRLLRCEGWGLPLGCCCFIFPSRSYLIFWSAMESSSSFNHGSLLEESSGSCNLETTGGSSSLHSLFPSTSGSFWALEEDAAGGSFSLPDLSKASGQMPLLISAPTSTSPMMTKPAAQ